MGCLIYSSKQKVEKNGTTQVCQQKIGRLSRTTSLPTPCVTNSIRLLTTGYLRKVIKSNVPLKRYDRTKNVKKDTFVEVDLIRKKGLQNRLYQGETTAFEKKIVKKVFRLS